MTSPFKLKSAMIFPGDHSYVFWEPAVHKFVTSFILADYIFGVMHCDTVGFGVQLNSGETECMWINKENWLVDKSKNYSHYIQTMYKLTGLVFKKKQEAEIFLDWIEKKYTWECLRV